MDFMSRGRSNNMQNQPVNSSAPRPHRAPRRGLLGLRILRVELFTVVVGAALILAALALYAGLASPGSESKQINDKEYQAIFLTNGQVYFGKITELNSKYAVLKNIFYIENSANANTNTTQQSQNNNYTLRKLGTSELHQPEDKMVINRDTITFWENLKDGSQVVTKIKEYYKNPSGSSTGNSTNTTPSTSTPQSGTGNTANP